uniref:Uncharacterized protein n=1 Tax=Anguilla anguilla TaxID=7936 RepID=A0A0E9TKQ7_ANGAN
MHKTILMACICVCLLMPVLKCWPTQRYTYCAMVFVLYV